SRHGRWLRAEAASRGGRAAAGRTVEIPFRIGPAPGTAGHNAGRSAARVRLPMDALTHLPSLPSLAMLQPGELPPAPASEGPSASGFGDLFQRALHQVDAVQHEAARQV